MLLHRLSKVASASHQSWYDATRTSISQTEYFISNFEAHLCSATETLNDTRKFHAQGLWCLRGYWILTLALKQIHTVETEGFNFHYRVRIFRLGFGYFGDE